MDKVDYSGALLKLQRAQTHIAELDYLVFRYLRQHPYRIRHESDFGSGKHGFYVALTQPLPAEIPVVIGDAIHNLRATLDYLISACAVANRRSPNDTGFPTATDRLDLAQRIKNKVRKAGEAAQQIVGDLKPYPGGTDALVHLHQLDLIDKHRTVLIVAGAGDFRYRHIARSDQPEIIVKDRVYLLGDEECFVPDAPDREGRIPFEIGLTVEVVFPSDGPLGNIPCVKALNEMAALVHGIVQQFQDRCP